MGTFFHYKMGTYIYYILGLILLQNGYILQNGSILLHFGYIITEWVHYYKMGFNTRGIKLDVVYELQSGVVMVNCLYIHIEHT